MNRRCFDTEHEIFRESFRNFVKREVLPHSERWREAGIADREIYQKAGAQGYLLIWADEQYGGLGIKDFRYEQIIMEELAKVGETSFVPSLHSRLVAPYLGRLANEEQKLRFLPKCITGESILAIAMTEPAAGSDLAGMKARAEDKGDYYLLNGSKTYITNGLCADLVIVAAKTNPDKPNAIGLFVVERGMKGFERGSKLQKMGMPGQDTAELFFDNVKVPKQNLLGDPALGFRYMMQGLAEERLLVTVMSIATAQAALDMTTEFVSQRMAFGKPLSALQNTRFKLAELKAHIDAIQVFADFSVAEHNAERLTPELAAEGKLIASELLSRVADECVQLHGGAGFMDEYPISRIFRDTRVYRIFAGTSEIMKEIIARSMFDKNN